MMLRRILNRGPHMSPAATTLLAGAALTAALLAGYDYIQIPDEDPTLISVEQAVPLDAWGWYLIISATLAVIGWIIRRWWITAIAHSALTGIYLALGIGLIFTITDSDGDYGWRYAGMRLLVAAVHACLTVTAWEQWDIAREHK